MSVHPLVKIAWEFHDLIRDQSASQIIMARVCAFLDASFEQVVSQRLAENGKQLVDNAQSRYEWTQDREENTGSCRPSPFDIVCRNEFFEPGKEVALSLDEKCVLLAALYDEYCTGRRKLGPAIDVGPMSSEPLKEASRSWPWAAMRRRARDLLESPNSEEYALQAERWLADVRADIQANAKDGVRNTRGRRRDSSINPDADKRLVKDWRAAKNEGATRAFFCGSRGIKVRDLIRALDRVRKTNLDETE